MKAWRLGAATERFHLLSAGLLHQGGRHSEWLQWYGTTSAQNTTDVFHIVLSSNTFSYNNLLITYCKDMTGLRLTTIGSSNMRRLWNGESVEVVTETVHCKLLWDFAHLILAFTNHIYRLHAGCVAKQLTNIGLDYRPGQLWDPIFSISLFSSNCLYTTMAEENHFLQV